MRYVKITWTVLIIGIGTMGSIFPFFSMSMMAGRCLLNKPVLVHQAAVSGYDDKRGWVSSEL